MAPHSRSRFLATAVLNKRPLVPPARFEVTALSATTIASVASAGLLALGLLAAAWTDWRTREVRDGLWLGLAVAGLLLGFVPFLEGSVPHGPLDGRLGLVLWVVLGLFVIEHLLPWDEALGTRYPNLPGRLELAAYVVVGIAVIGGALEWGLGASGVPVAVVAVYLGIVFARVLFELGLLYGGADAKAIMVASLLVPLWEAAPLSPSGPAHTLLGIYPFAVTMLMNAALLSVAVPLGLALRNLRRGDFTFPRGFTGFHLPVAELSRSFVWIKDPTFDRASEEAAVETSEDDQRLRERRQAELTAQGVTSVWVTPQLPFVVLLAAGAIVSLLAGNLLFDLAQLL